MESHKFTYQQNGFDFIRYYAAICVMALHFSSAYLMYTDNCNSAIARFVRNWALCTPGVVILFAVSGFFAMASLAKTENTSHPVLTYMKGRFLRIYPELWINFLINFLIIVILFHDHIDFSIIKWIPDSILGIAITPECLENFGTGSVNGALWTVFVQIQIFFVLALLYRFLKKARPFAWGCLIVFCAVLNVLCRYFSGLFGGNYLLSKLIERSFFPYFIWPLLGAFIFNFKERLIPILKKIWPILIGGLIISQIVIYNGVSIGSVNLSSILDYGYYIGLIFGIFASIAFIGLAYALPKKRIKDISYSLFLYHWISLNILVHFDLFNKWGGAWCLVFFVGMSVAMATGSNIALLRIKRCFSNQEKVSR